MRVFVGDDGVVVGGMGEYTRWRKCIRRRLGAGWSILEEVLLVRRKISRWCRSALSLGASRPATTTLGWCFGSYIFHRKSTISNHFVLFWLCTVSCLILIPYLSREDVFLKFIVTCFTSDCPLDETPNSFPPRRSICIPNDGYSVTAVPTVQGFRRCRV